VGGPFGQALCAGETGKVQWVKVPYGEGVAIHAGPESCAGARKGVREALTGERAGRPLSREMTDPRREPRVLRGADAVVPSGRPGPMRRKRETQRDPARSKTPSMHGSILRGNREVLRPSRWERDRDRTGKSKDERQ
jgi:hypothetical protein